MAKFAVAGIVQVETIVKIPNIPIEYEPVRVASNSIYTNLGGDAYNERVALRALSDEVKFFSMIGKSDLKELFLEEEILDENDFVLPVLSATPNAVVMYDSCGRQQLFEDIKNLRDVAYNEELFVKGIKDVDCVVLANANFCRPFARIAKEMGKTLAINFRGFSEAKMEYNKDFFEVADIIYVSDDNLVASADDFIKKLIDEYPAKIIILGQGAKGLTIFSREDDMYASYKPVKTNEIVNTSGAGNSLFSCFLHCYISKHDAVHAIKNALLFASYKMGYMGTSKGFLTEDELEHWYRLIWGPGK